MISLTDEENPFRRKQGEYDYNEQPYEADAFDEGAKAQLKKVKDYGSTKCPHDSSGRLLRRDCRFCWQALLEEIK